MQTCFNKITLNQGISRRNFLGCLLHYFMLSFIFVSIDSLQPYLFQKSFQVERKQTIQNFKNTLVITLDIIVKLLCAPLFGYLCDRLGRKIINLYGIICISVTMFAMPYAPSYQVYVLFRCVYATGAIAISVLPLLADYVSHRSRGTSAAFLVLMSSLGALGSAELNFSILKYIDDEKRLYIQYGTISAIILVLGIFYTLVCLKAGNSYYISGGKHKTVKEMWVIAKTTFKNPEIVSSYSAAFLARGDSILLSLYLVLWTYKFYDTSSDKAYDDAFSKSSMLSGLSYAVIMFTCIIYGFYYERKTYSRAKIMMAMLVLAATGSLLINFASSPESFMAYISLIVLGLGMSGLLTASLYLVNQFSTPESRGFITGIQTFFGVIGILFQTVIGAVLYEFVSRAGPFDYFAGTCLVMLCITMYLYKTTKQQLTNPLIQEDLGQSTLTNENQITHENIDNQQEKL